MTTADESFAMMGGGGAASRRRQMAFMRYGSETRRDSDSLSRSRREHAKQLARMSYGEGTEYNDAGAPTPSSAAFAADFSNAFPSAARNRSNHARQAPPPQQQQQHQHRNHSSAPDHRFFEEEDLFSPQAQAQAKTAAMNLARNPTASLSSHFAGTAAPTVPPSLSSRSAASNHSQTRSRSGSRVRTDDDDVFRPEWPSHADHPISTSSSSQQQQQRPQQGSRGGESYELDYPPDTSAAPQTPERPKQQVSPVPSYASSTTMGSGGGAAARRRMRNQMRAAKTPPSKTATTSYHRSESDSCVLEQQQQQHRQQNQTPPQSPHSMKRYHSADFSATGDNHHHHSTNRKATDHVSNYSMSHRPAGSNRSVGSATRSVTSSASSEQNLFDTKATHGGFTFDAFGLDASQINKEVSQAMHDIAGSHPDLSFFLEADPTDDFAAGRWDASPAGSRSNTPLPPENSDGELDGFVDGFRVTKPSMLPVHVRQQHPSPTSTDRSSLTSSESQTEPNNNTGSINLFKQKAGFHESRHRVVVRPGSTHTSERTMGGNTPTAARPQYQRANHSGPRGGAAEGVVVAPRMPELADDDSVQQPPQYHHRRSTTSSTSSTMASHDRIVEQPQRLQQPSRTHSQQDDVEFFDADFSDFSSSVPPPEEDDGDEGLEEEEEDVVPPKNRQQAAREELLRQRGPGRPAQEEEEEAYDGHGPATRHYQRSANAGLWDDDNADEYEDEPNYTSAQRWKQHEQEKLQKGQGRLPANHRTSQQQQSLPVDSQPARGYRKPNERNSESKVLDQAKQASGPGSNAFRPQEEKKEEDLREQLLRQEELLLQQQQQQQQQDEQSPIKSVGALKAKWEAQESIIKPWEQKSKPKQSSYEAQKTEEPNVGYRNGQYAAKPSPRNVSFASNKSDSGVLSTDTRLQSSNSRFASAKSESGAAIQPAHVNSILRGIEKNSPQSRDTTSDVGTPSPPAFANVKLRKTEKSPEIYEDRGSESYDNDISEQWAQHMTHRERQDLELQQEREEQYRAEQALKEAKGIIAAAQGGKMDVSRPLTYRERRELELQKELKNGYGHDEVLDEAKEVISASKPWTSPRTARLQRNMQYQEQNEFEMQRERTKRTAERRVNDANNANLQQQFGQLSLRQRRELELQQSDEDQPQDEWTSQNHDSVNDSTSFDANQGQEKLTYRERHERELQQERERHLAEERVPQPKPLDVAASIRKRVAAVKSEQLSSIEQPPARVETNCEPPRGRLADLVVQASPSRRNNATASQQPESGLSRLHMLRALQQESSDPDLIMQQDTFEKAQFNVGAESNFSDEPFVKSQKAHTPMATKMMLNAFLTGRDSIGSTEAAATAAADQDGKSASSSSNDQEAAAKPLSPTSSRPALKDDPKYERYFKMLKIGMPMDVVKHAMTRDGLDPTVMDGDHSKPAGVPLKEDPTYQKYFKMLSIGLPMEAVKHAMARDGLDPNVMDGNHDMPAHVSKKHDEQDPADRDSHRRARLHKRFI